MTDRDHFAAAALTGLLSNVQRYQNGPLTSQAFEIADFMLRERCRAWADCPVPDNALNRDAAPAARAPEPEPSAARRRPAGGTGKTQSFDAYAMFAGSVMNWISEATSAADWSSEGGRKIMADACCRCWDAFDCIAYPTVHGASPEARASVDSVAPRPSEGTGDTQEPVAWGVANGNGLLATSIHRIDAVDMQSEHECDTAVVPLYRHPPCQVFLQKNLTLTDAEREAVETCIADDEAMTHHSRAATLRGLLERLGGER